MTRSFHPPPRRSNTAWIVHIVLMWIIIFGVGAWLLSGGAS